MKCIIRKHGLGNVLELCDLLSNTKEKFIINTQKKWIPGLKILFPYLHFICNEISKDMINLDEFSKNKFVTKHRKREYKDILHIKEMKDNKHKIPIKKTNDWLEMQNKILISIEGGHPSRNWPLSYLDNLVNLLGKENVVITGEKKTKKIFKNDYRGDLDFKTLIDLVLSVNTIICTDSGILHLAKILKKPIVAIFSCIDPIYRTSYNNSIIILQSNLICCPCNKDIKCGGVYHCIKKIKPKHVLYGLNQLNECNEYKKVLI